MAANIKDFRRTVTVSSGPQVLLRILTPRDREQLVELFNCATDDDLQFFRDDVRDRRLVARWAEQINLAHVIPIVAVVQDRIVGEAMLILGRGCDRHIGEIHVYLCPEFRGRGLGNAMIKALMDIGQDLKLLLLYARTAASRTKDIRAFQALGFKVEHTFKDRFMDAAGDTQDAVEVTLYLRRPSTTL